MRDVTKAVSAISEIPSHSGKQTAIPPHLRLYVCERWCIWQTQYLINHLSSTAKEHLQPITFISKA